MDRLAELQRKIADVNCPNCLHAELELQMRCDLGFKDCLYVALCRPCGYSFNVETETRWIIDTFPEMEKKLRETGCPNCGSIRLVLSMRCEMEAKRCFYVATCDICDYSFRLRGMTGPLPPTIESAAT